MKPNTAPSSRRADRVLLCVDVSYQCYRAAAAHPGLSYDGVFTGGLFGFYTSVAKVIAETRATYVAYCLDVKPYVRSRDFPAYKMARAANRDEELYEKAKLTKEQVVLTLSELGFTPWGIPGFESDDLIGWAGRQYRHRFHRIWAASNDSDIYQLFCHPNFRQYRGQGIGDYMDAERLWTMHRLTPQQYTLATALSGTHNCVPGIPKVGPVTSIKAVKDPALMRHYRDKHAELIDRNIGLIQLPHPEFPRTARLPPMPAAAPDSRAFIRLLGRYGISASQQVVAAFEDLTYRDNTR